MEREELSKLGGGGVIDKAPGLGSWSIPGEVCWLHGTQWGSWAAGWEVFVQGCSACGHSEVAQCESRLDSEGWALSPA